MNEVPKPENLSHHGNQRKVFIKTYGCQMNVYDSERMGDALAVEGYAATGEIGEADLIVINTCHIREKAVEKVYSQLGRIRKLKDQRALAGLDTMVAVTGCVAQAEGPEIRARVPMVDVVAGPQSYHRLGEYLRQARVGKPVIATDFEIDDKFESLPPATRRQTLARGVAAFLTVQEGCDKFCSFCVVPYTRGAEASRPASQILEEARRLADAGVREITLLGQNVNAWHARSQTGEAMRLGDLLRELSAIDGVERLRYTTSHPIDMDESLIEAHRELPKLMPYLHLPVQSGSDAILKAMNRRHDRGLYLDIIAHIREARPGIAISGDFIVGFPGESDADFEATLDLVRQVNYAQAYSFKYSQRPGTPGADMPDQVPDEAKAERLLELQALLQAQQHAFNRSLLGSEADVLIEKRGRYASQYIARSPWLQSVIVDASAGEIGDIVKVRITEAGPLSLKAAVFEPGKTPE
ncbi:MAG TPA: tRNA (N6-isopentenyl adenosine(37)-C2)-methylthiotransferase MiaB [Rhizobiaceae bacterium]|nr:tRNA (N6-isopentenyl adenosine(37)-C2)-methylthiotransferase MiaB [Rhizobiaceae bacterium]